MMTSPIRGLSFALLIIGACRLEVRAARVAEDVRGALRRAGTVVAIVELQTAGLPGPSSPSTSVAAGRFDRLQDLVLSRLRGSGLRLRHRFRFSPVLVLEVEQSAVLDALESTAQVRAVRLDAAGGGALVESRAMIGIDEAFELGFTGADRVVAVLDTGVDTDHPDFEGALIHEYHYVSGDEGPGAEDDHGHGTNVAGILAGRGTVAPRGVAPGAKVVAVKVLDSNNRGFLSDWAAGVEHVIALHDESNDIRVDAINMSLVSDTDFQDVCDDFSAALSAACRAALERGIALYASSGNKGSVVAMTSPACYSSTASVGSVLDTLPDSISTFTSRNRLLDLLAPGQPITAAGRDGGTSTFSGTSQACPHVAGAALLLRQIDPEASPELMLELQEATGVRIFDEETGLAFPRIDVLRAVQVLVEAEDCNGNGRIDFFDLTVDRTSVDCNRNGVPDECDLSRGTSADCNRNDIPDECDIESGRSKDIDGNGRPDECEVAADFHRGDPNLDGSADISDAIFLLLFLFRGGPETTCAESADVNNDGGIDISDPIGLLNFLFIGGPPPDAPGAPPSPCGQDVDSPGSGGWLGCRVYDRC